MRDEFDTKNGVLILGFGFVFCAVSDCTLVCMLVIWALSRYAKEVQQSRNTRIRNTKT